MGTVKLIVLFGWTTSTEYLLRCAAMPYWVSSLQIGGLSPQEIDRLSILFLFLAMKVILDNFSEL